MSENCYGGYSEQVVEADSRCISLYEKETRRLQVSLGNELEAGTVVQLFGPNEVGPWDGVSEVFGILLCDTNTLSVMKEAPILVSGAVRFHMIKFFDGVSHLPLTTEQIVELRKADIIAKEMEAVL